MKSCVPFIWKVNSDDNDDDNTLVVMICYRGGDDYNYTVIKLTKENWGLLQSI